MVTTHFLHKTNANNSINIYKIKNITAFNNLTISTLQSYSYASTTQKEVE